MQATALALGGASSGLASQDLTSVHCPDNLRLKPRSSWSCLSTRKRYLQRASAVPEGEDSVSDGDATSTLFKTFSFNHDEVVATGSERSPEHKRPMPGLYRTPISGGVETATSSHGLPRPELAARNLMEQARFAHLCTIMSRMHHRRSGYPFGTLVDFAVDSHGHPILLLSPLEIHTRNLQADPRCTLVVQVPGCSGLGNARATLFGDVYPVPPEEKEEVHRHYTMKHQQGASQQWGHFHYYRMQRISDIFFVGGFGTVTWIDVNEYETTRPDVIAADGDEETLKELNAIFSRPLRDLLSAESETDIDDAMVISIDSKGIDIRVRQGAKRLSFDGGHPVETLDQAKAALNKLLADRMKAA